MARIYDPNTNSWVNPPSTAGQATPSGVGRSGNTFTVQPNQQMTVQGQMAGLLSRNTPYMQINEQRGMQQAASRGLLNSTLATQAGRRAAIEGALPIAAADSATYAQAAAQNARALNEVQVAELNRQAATAQGGGVVIQNNALDEEARFEREKEMLRLQSQLRREERGEDREFEREGRNMEFADRAIDREWRADQSAQDRGLTREQWVAEAEQRALDRGMTREQWQLDLAERERDREFERETRDYLRRNQSEDRRQEMFFEVFMSSLGTTLSSPDFFRDPQASEGFLNFFTNAFSDIYNRFFGPGGGATPAPSTPPGGG